MSSIGIDEQRQDKVFELLAAVLHVGNLQFGVENEVCVTVGENADATLEIVASLLSVKVDALQRALLTRQLHVGGKVIVQQQNVEQVRDKRDALAKSIYSSLFLWLVKELNRTISRAQNKWGFIGVLDIYGFEKFEWNTFEQLCINYANEKLQRHFNQHMLEVEQEEYTKEGIDWKHIEFSDNQQCLDLIESKVAGKPGIFITLDDQWRLKGDEANRKFVASLHAAFGRSSAGGTTAKPQNDFYVHPKVDAHINFGIRHYAGEVIYDASGFNDKNNETLNDDMKELIRQSESDWLRGIFNLSVQSIEAIPGNTKRQQESFSRRPSENKAGGGGHGGGNKSRNLREVSVSAQFRHQLQELMNKISLANPRYVRCIKPNEYKRPNELNDVDCARQLKYSGMMEAIQIRQRGFALREDHDVFFYDYQALAPEAENIGELIEEISTMLGAGKDQWQLGKTKVFLKRTVAFKLRKLEVLRSKAAARTLQRWARNMKRSEAAIKIQTKARQFSAKLKLAKLRRSAYKLVYILRMRVAMSKYQARLAEFRVQNKQAVKVQALARGYLVRKQNLLHPFDGLGPKELDLKISEMEEAIAQAARNKQFELCSNLQKDLEVIVEARKKVRTAKEIDGAIKQLNEDMEQAAQQKQFARCAELQKQLEELQEARKNVKEDLNELEPEELDERIHAVENSISEAMAARDFEKCGMLQNDLDKLVTARKKKQTPQELDAEIARLNAEIASLMQRKEFDKCAQVQKDIDVLKKRRSKFKTESPPLKPEPSPELPELPVDGRVSPAPSAGSQPQLSIVPPVSAPAALPGTNPTTRVPASSPRQRRQPSPVRKGPTVGGANGTNQVTRPSSAAATSTVTTTKVTTTTVTKPTPSVSKPVPTTKPTTPAPALSRAPSKPIIGAGVLTKPPVEPRRPRSGSNSSAVSANSFARSAVSGASNMSKLKKQRESTASTTGTATTDTGAAGRTVARLRPAKAVTVTEDATIAEASKIMKSSRAAAVLVTNWEGGLTGIFSDTDTARRVVSQGLDPATTIIGSVMTPNPTCVSVDDSAVDALDTMLSGKFRHLPVVGSDGSIVGLLNVAKCLNDAIRRIESMSSSLQQELGNANTLLRGMLEKMLSPSLRDVLSAPGEPQAPLVYEHVSVYEVTEHMAATKKPALVVSDTEPMELIGIFTPKDLLTRVLAAELDVYSTTVGEVMTTNPESAPPDTTVLDAFHIMHDGRFLNLPVVAPGTGEIFGVADVLSLSLASFGQSESRELGRFFSAALDNDFDDTGSMSGKSISGKSISAKSASSVTSKARQRKDRDNEINIRPVSSLRPSPALTISENASVFDAAMLMMQKRSDALLAVDEAGGLAGILTDTDICRRVLAADLSPAETAIGSVMTRDIQYVAPSDNAIDALLTMQDGHFRHLPVVDNGAIAGVLNIGRCIYDVSKRLEHATNSSEQLKASLEKKGAAVNQLLGPMLQKLASPTITNILENDEKTGVSPAPRVTRSTIVSEAVKAMAAAKKAVLVVDDLYIDRLVGTFSPNELVMNVIAKSLDPYSTYVEEVMLSDPEFATPVTSVLDALHIMHDSQCLNLPVLLEDSSDVIGLVDVLSLSYGTIDAIYGENREQMQEFWNVALQLDQPSTTSNAGSNKRQRKTLSKVAPQEANRTVAQLRPSKVMTVTESTTVSELSRLMGRTQSDSVLVVSDEGLLTGIITDTDLTRRVVSENLPVESTYVGDVMTRDPTFVSMEDSAIDALILMLEGKFRHLPVVEKDGPVVGILNIGKCLYDAIRKMEKSEQSSAALKQSLEKEMRGRGGRANVQQLLGSMVNKMFSPDVKSVLDGEGVEPPRVQPYTSVYEVSKQMAATKKAALVVSNRGQYFGLFTPKDMLERVLARGLPVQTTPVCEVMQEHAPTIYGATSVIDAMHTMHDQKTLYLTVLQSEASLQAIGLVDVLSLSYGTFAKGSPSDWRTFWNASFEAADDDDDTSSVHSFRSNFSHNRGGSNAPSHHEKVIRRANLATGEVRPVSKLRPSKSVTISDAYTVSDAAKEMSLTHADAALVISRDGALLGILTDTDVTRRVVALGNDPNYISVLDAMTPNPQFVDERDSAMDAMYMMLEGKFRHLPVIDPQGMVAGMLRIQKCLYDAITRLEKAMQSSSGAIRDRLEKQLMASGLANNQGTLQQLVGPMVDKMLSPTLDSILENETLPPLVREHDTVMEVARQMSASRKGALIIEDLEPDRSSMDSYENMVGSTVGKRLIGVFTPKDLLLRVIGAGLDAAMTTVGEVMTPNPETVLPTTTLVDAMHVMHEHKFLHLPVVDEAGTIVGMVDVLSLCYGTFAHNAAAEGGEADWHSFWDVSLALAKTDDERSEVMSVGHSVTGSRTSRARRMGRSRSHTASSRGSTARREAEGALRPVSKLRPRQVTRIDEFITVAEAAQRMRHARVEAVVVTNEIGELRGILTDTDITRRVLAQDIDPEICTVAEVMTVNPSCVRSDDQAIEAITKMLEGRFKHLPVLNAADGTVQGMLDISKCLYDAINCMESVQQSTETAASEFSRDLGGAGTSLHRLLGPMMEKMVRPTVALALDGEAKPPIVDKGTTVAAAAKMMAVSKKAAIVLVDNEVCGMVTPKDLLRKLVAKGLSAETTAVEDVMTFDPEFLRPDARILDGLRLMHDAGQLFMPVLTEFGEIFGMADVLCLSYGQFSNSSAGNNGDWRQFWQTALNLQDEAAGMYDMDDAHSVGTIEEFERSEFRSVSNPSAVGMGGGGGGGGSAVGGRYSASASAYAELGESVSVISAAQTTSTSVMMRQMTEEAFIFKVSDRAQGHYHRIMCRYDSIAVLFDQVRSKMAVAPGDEVRVKYEDDDGDLALLTSDESLIEAVTMAKRAGWKRLVLLVDVIKREVGGGSVVSAVSGVSAASSAVSSNASGGEKNKQRRRKLTKVDEDIESEPSEPSSEESSEDEAERKRRLRRKKKKSKKSSLSDRFSTGSNNSATMLAAAGAVVLGTVATGLMLFLRRKN